MISRVLQNSVRLNFSHSAPEIIEEGVRRLARALKAPETQRCRR